MFFKPEVIMIGAEEGTRTPTGFLPQPPQGCVYTSFTTSACISITGEKHKKCIRNVSDYQQRSLN